LILDTIYTHDLYARTDYTTVHERVMQCMPFFKYGNHGKR